MKTLSVVETEAIENLISRLDIFLSKFSPSRADELDDLVSMEQAAEILGISKYTLYNKTSTKEIPFFRKGKRNYFSRKALADYIRNSNKVA
jgi:excisionase family DNA binding protein